MLAEVAVAKLAQLRGSDLPTPRKIFLPQDALNPDIDRKSSQLSEGKEHHEMGTWGAAPGHRGEARARPLIRRPPPRSQLPPPRVDPPCREEKVFRAIA